MEKFLMGTYDVVVVGAGHAGCEAGLAAARMGMKTLMLSFLKDDPEYGEARAAKSLLWFTLRQVGRDAFVNFHNPDPVDLKMCRDGWEEAKEAISSHAADIIILDELNIVLATRMLPTQEIVDFLREHKNNVEVITTGRGAPEELIKIADLVTDMSEVKHYFHKGVSSRNGIDH